MEVHVSDGSGSSGRSKSKIKKRFKFLNKICQQMEFYFSDSNLAKDKFLTQQIAKDPDGYVEVECFLKFNKIRALTSDTQDIVDALASSEILEVTCDGERLHRKTAVERRDFDASTIYVERLPSNADHKWLRDVFSRFGNVTHTSIPHFRASGKVKGFAFVEFESPECVAKACKHFKPFAESGESDSGEESDDPKDKKTSAKGKKSQSHTKEHQLAKGKDGLPHRSGKKRKRTESEGSERAGVHRQSVENGDGDGKSAKQTSEIITKEEIVDIIPSDQEISSKRNSIKSTVTGEPPEAVAPNGDSEPPHKKQRLKPSQQENKKEVPSRSTALEVGSADESDQMQLDKSDGHFKKENETQSSKPKRNRHRKKKNKPDDKPQLRILTKAEWRSYRNKYLTLQRACMVQVKKMLCLDNKQGHFEGEADEEEDNFEEHCSEKELSPIKTVQSGVQFQPGVIIKLRLPEPIENCKKLRTQLRSCAEVSYIDAPEGCAEAYVRCPNAEVVSTIMEEARFAELGETEVLTGDAESTYWSKVQADREAKLNNKMKHKKRGRDKMISKASKMLEISTHVHFDD